jgi:hypothetical protein
MNPNEYYHCKAKVCRCIGVTFFSLVPEKLFAPSEHVNTSSDNKQFGDRRTALKRLSHPPGT